MHPSCFIIIISNFSQTLEKVLQIPYKKRPEGRLETFGWERKKLFEKEKVFFSLHYFEKRKSEIRFRHPVNNFSKKEKV